MSAKVMKCKTCGGEIAKSAKVCPHCGGKIKKSIFKKWWFWGIIVVLVILIAGGSGDTANPDPDDNSSLNGSNESTQGKDSGQESTAPVQTAYYVGDVLVDGDLKIVYMSSGEYTEENEFMQPADGYKYIYLQFAFENVSEKHDVSVSSYSFNCYADGYAAESYYGGEDALSATLSAGRATTGYVYFTIPESASQIEIEYDTNIFLSDKIDFVYEGEKNSGYAVEMNASATEGAIAVGGVTEGSNLKITYLSCQEYTSDNMFVQPKEGYRYISCEFEFENTGSSDEFISSLDFDCFADGVSCEATYIREDNLSATLSAGRKTKGTVTFEVPIDAAVIEVEYVTNYWTSNRVVFTVK